MKNALDASALKSFRGQSEFKRCFHTWLILPVLMPVLLVGVPERGTAQAFSTLHSFTGTDGANPSSSLIMLGGVLYGTAWGGGTFAKGTVFSLSFLPQLSITNSGTMVTLSWPTNVAGFEYTGFALQSNTNLTSATWMLVAQAPVVVNGQETVTVALSGKNGFYRLVK